MDFLRPEARRVLGAFALPAFLGAFAAFAAVRALAAASWVGASFWAATGFLAVFAIRDVLRRRRLRSERAGPGIVRTREGQFAYLGPESGGVVEIGSLVAVELRADPLGKVWIFHQTGTEPVEVPLAALGSEALVDLMTGHGGIPMARLIAALETRSGSTATVWRAPGEERLCTPAPVGPALAPPRRHH